MIIIRHSISYALSGWPQRFSRKCAAVLLALFGIFLLSSTLRAQEPAEKKKAVRDTQISAKAGGSFSVRSDYFRYAELYYGTEGTTSSVAGGIDLYDGETALQFGMGVAWFKTYYSAMKVGSLIPVTVSGNLTASQWLLPITMQARYFFLGNLYMGAGAGFALMQLDFKVEGTSNSAYDTMRSEFRLIPVVSIRLGDEFVLTEKIFLGFQAEIFYSFAKYDVAGNEKALSSLHFMPSVAVGYYF